MPVAKNILLIHADQHRFDCLGCTGNADVQTPHIDALAADGVTYDNSFCPHPICTPSRYSLLSGLYIHQHLGVTNHSTLSTGLATFPRSCQAQGFRTTAVGKMHFTPTYLDVGFDRMLLAEQNGAGRYEDDYHRWLRSEGLCDSTDLIDQVAEYRQQASDDYWATFGAQESNLDEAHHSTTWIADRACDELAGWDADGQNLMMVGFIKPHHPFDPPAPWSRMYEPESLQLLPDWTESLIHGDSGKGYFDFTKLTPESLRQVMAMYYATISQIDHHVGRMVALLRERGLYDQTMIIYTSDHGEYMGCHHRLLKSHRMYDSVVRVPLVIKYPGQSDAGSRDAQLVNNIDVGPTMLAAAGVPIPEFMAGHDIHAADSAAPYVFAETNLELMARSARYKLLYGNGEHGNLFFDLQEDPQELTNLADSPAHAEIVAEHVQALQQWRFFTASPPANLDEQARTCSNAAADPGRDSMYSYFKSEMS